MNAHASAVPRARTRIAFVWAPGFLLQAHAGEGGAGSALGTLAVLEEGASLSPRARLSAVGPALAALGVRRGMTLAAARAQAGEVHPLGYVRAHVEARSARVLARLFTVTPNVCAAGPGAFWMSAAGVSRLARPGEDAEERFAALVRAELAELGHPDAEVGIAGSVIAARAAALYRLGIVPAGADARALAPLPLTVLPLPDAMRTTLWCLGLRRVGELAALPPDHVADRFGAEGIAVHRLAHGLDPRTVPEARDEAPLTAEADFEVAVETLEPVLFVLKGALERLFHPLVRRGLAVTTVRVVLGLLDGDAWSRVLCPAEPASEPRVVLEMLRLGGADGLAAPVRRVRVEITGTTEALARQPGLLVRGRKRQVDLGVVLARLQGRLGPEAVDVHAVDADEHLRERVGRWRALEQLGTTKASGSKGEKREARPAAHVEHCETFRLQASGLKHPGTVWRLLARPLAVAVMLEDAVPVSLRVAGARAQCVRRAAGPERVQSRWWDPDGGVRRDDWQLEVDGGRVLWLVHDLVLEQWFVYGVLD